MAAYMQLAIAANGERSAADGNPRWQSVLAKRALPTIQHMRAKHRALEIHKRENNGPLTKILTEAHLLTVFIVETDIKRQKVVQPLDVRRLGQHRRYLRRRHSGVGRGGWSTWLTERGLSATKEEHQEHRDGSSQFGVFRFLKRNPWSNRRVSITRGVSSIGMKRDCETNDVVSE
jgi:hypothetical protein